MKHLWAHLLKDYFTFSKRDRFGILAILIAGLATVFYPRFVAGPPAVPPDSAFLKQVAELKVRVDSSSSAYSSSSYKLQQLVRAEPHSLPASKQALFVFDPNTLDASGWERLGLRASTIRTIRNFRSKGFVFR